MAQINIKKCAKRPAVHTEKNPKFGTIFAPHMLKLSIGPSGFENLTAEILPLEGQSYKPTLISLHYAQSIFEGMKAFRQQDGSVKVFRSDLHAKRFNQSAIKMSMIPFPPEIFMECLHAYVDFEQESVPSEESHALYLRPVMFGSDNVVKMGRSQNYDFYIISCVVGDYFQGKGVSGAKLLVNKQFVRAYPGGTGEAKTAGNYAASLPALAQALQMGCDQVLYLDAEKREFIDELGGMNFFMIKGKELVTPNLTGTILDGVTRRSILEMAKDFGLSPSERPISITDLVSDIKAGRVEECFACGTAAVVQPIAELVFQGDKNVQPEVVKLASHFEMSKKILQRVQDVQRGRVDEYKSWLFS